MVLGHAANRAATRKQDARSDWKDAMSHTARLIAGFSDAPTTWIGRMSMSLMCRGRITAHAAVICATVGALSLAMPRPAGAAYATDSTQSNLSMPQTSSPASADVLLMSAAEPQAVDIQWALYDHRQMLPDIAAQNDALPVSAPSQVSQAISEPSISQLPHVEAPAPQESASDINDKLVPLPVIHLGWAVLLCALLFNLGARVLRIRRRVRTF